MCIRPLVQYGPCNSFSLGLLNGWCVGLVYNFYSNIIFSFFNSSFVPWSRSHLSTCLPPVLHKSIDCTFNISTQWFFYISLLLKAVFRNCSWLPYKQRSYPFQPLQLVFIFLPNTNPIGVIIYIFAWFLVCSLLPTRIKVPWHRNWMCSDHFSISNVWNPAASQKMLCKCLLKTCLSWHLILTEQFAYKILLQTCLYPK